jgi:alpha-tubulin suppressor-like RCC1 family protein
MTSRWLTLTLALLVAACGGDTSTPDPDPTPDPGPSPAAKGLVSAGAHHTCAFNASGETWCWGRNQYGEQGTTGSGSPVPVQARITGLADVVAGNQATCGLKTDGTFWCWGRILGHDEDILLSPPKQLTVFGTDVRYFDMAEDTAYVTKKDGSIWTHSQGTTRQVFPSGAGTLSVYYGDSVCFVKTDGTLGCQGNNDAGNLGDGTTTSGAVQVKVPDGTLFQQVSVGGNFACGLTTTGEVWCWGANEEAQTGTRESAQDCIWSGAGATPCNPTPRKITGLPAPANALVLLTDGTVWGWGSNGSFELGQEITETCPNVFSSDPCSSTPVKVPVQNMVSLSAGSAHVCGCDASGTAWCWGSSGSGKLGTTTLPNASGDEPPVQVQSFRCW